MPKFLENKLKAEYGANSAIPYKVMNKIGAMHGNKETPKGAAMARQHARDMKKAPRQKGPTDGGALGVAGKALGQSHKTSHPGRNLGKFIHNRRG